MGSKTTSEPNYSARARKARKMLDRVEAELARGNVERAERYRAQAIAIRDDLLVHHRCIVCGRPLKTEESRKRGFGAECADSSSE